MTTDSTYAQTVITALTRHDPEYTVEGGLNTVSVVAPTGGAVEVTWWSLSDGTPVGSLPFDVHYRSWDSTGAVSEEFREASCKTAAVAAGVALVMMRLNEKLAEELEST